MNAWPVCGAAFALVLAVGTTHAQTTSQQAVPTDPIAAIVEAFESQAVVALAEGAHANEQGHAFRLSLIRDPRFRETVDDIVVEFGNARYQNLMDRFIRGEDVPDDVLRHAWEDTSQPTAVWDRPIYVEFFRAVRSVNVSLPRGRMLRVLLGDPPVDWAVVQNSEYLRLWGDRDPHAAEVIRREVFEKGRKALVIYGAAHLLRADLSLIDLVERQNGTRVFTIWTHTGDDLTTLQPDVSDWRVPSLAMLHGTPLGAPGRDFFQTLPSGARLEQHFDALLYVGPPSQITFSEISAERCSDPDYLKVRLKRMEVLPEGRIKQANIDGLKQHCVAAKPQ